VRDRGSVGNQGATRLNVAVQEFKSFGCANNSR
jgi:hypothetical protein